MSPALRAVFETFLAHTPFAVADVPYPHGFIQVLMAASSPPTRNACCIQSTHEVVFA